MIISVASGKGGTGKTTVATSLAKAVDNLCLLDCDVEEPNSHIFINPQINQVEKVYIPVPEVDKEKCNLCGRCKEVCMYNVFALLKDSVMVFTDLCHGCGACSYLCPQKAIKEVNQEIGVIEKGVSKNIDFVHGKLNIGQAMAPPLIREVKKYISKDKVNIIDAPPGTSCPVVTAVKGTDFCILVTEPTPFGLNDLKLAVDVIKKMNIPFGVVINKADLGTDDTKKYCEKESVDILMEIAFSKKIAENYSKGKSILHDNDNLKKGFKSLYEKVLKIAEKERIR